MPMKLPRSFYIRSALVVAPELLGKHFVRIFGGTMLKGMITEVEAYMGAADPASHAFKGQTPRNSVMFREGGHLYVYFTYGMHYCANVVTGSADYAEAVLIRAVSPIQGLDAMIANRAASGKTVPEKDLSNGPAKFCQAFGIGRSENGTDLCGNEIFIEDAPPVSRRLIRRSERIGISMGKEHLWRFFLDPNTIGRLHPDAAARKR
jgi:DNA-3-methyladenine glycosylase